MERLFIFFQFSRPSLPEKQPKMSNDFDKTKSIHPVEWISHAVSLVVLIVIIICLTSSSCISVVTVDGEADIVMDL